MHSETVFAGPTNTITSGQLESEFAVRTWTVKNNLPHNRIHSLLQSSDGYLWIGTHEGLVRYDGWKPTVFDQNNTPALRNPDIYCLAEHPKGCLWIGTPAGLVRYQNHVFEAFPLLNNTTNAVAVRAICPRRQGGVWLATSLMPMHFNEERATLYTNYPTYIDDDVMVGDRRRQAVNQVLEDPQGTLWISDIRGLVRLTPGNSTFEILYEPSPGHGYWACGVNRLIIDSGGRIWFGNESGLYCHHSGQTDFFPANLFGLEGVIEPLAWEERKGLWIRARNGGISRWHNGQLTQYTVPQGVARTTVECLIQDREGIFWLGTDQAGLTCLRPPQLRVFTTKDGLCHDNVRSISPARDGGVWIATEQGLSRFWQNNFTTSYFIDQKTGNKPPDHNNLVAVWAARNGQVWAASRSDLYTNENHLLTGSTPPLGPELRFLLESRCLYEDRAGNLWVGTDWDLFRHQQGHWDRFGPVTTTMPEVQPLLVSKHILGLMEDTQGSLWIGTKGGVNRLYQGACQTFALTNSLPVEEVTPVLEDTDGTIWFASPRGLLRFKSNQFFLFTTQHGLIENRIFNALEDDYGWMWLNGNQGLQRIRKLDFLAVAEGKTNRVLARHYGERDGMLTAMSNGGYYPNSCKDNDGRLWFPTSQGVVVIDPRTVQDQVVAPPQAVIEQVLAGRQVVFGQGRKVPLPNSREIQLTPHQSRSLVFSYTASDFTAPERMRFRYRLEGFDPDWVEDQINRRIALYNPLPPGRYRFHLQAINRQGLTSEQTATLGIVVLPHFHETRAFYFLIAVLLLLITIALHYYRLYLQRHFLLLEKERSLTEQRARIAKDMHDDLGSSLTKIKLLSEPGEKEMLRLRQQQIADISREIMQNMDELVWTVNPKKDTLEDLASYLCSYAEDYFRLSSVRCRLDIPLLLPAWSISAEKRHHLFMAFKEALGNVSKHAQATEVRVQMTLEHHTLGLTIQDNGAGFESHRCSTTNHPQGRERVGNGLSNMRWRLEQVGGHCEIQSRPGQGTVVRFTLGLTETAS